MAQAAETQLIYRYKGNDKNFSSLEDAGEDWLDNNFPGWNSKSFIIPTIPWTQYNRYLGPERYGNDQSVKDKVRGDDAELAVYRELEEYCKSSEHPVFIICGFTFDPDDKTRNVRNVLCNCLAPEQVEQLEAFLSKWKSKLEIDFLLIHMKLGVIVVEVKAAEDYVSNYGKALKQVIKSEEFLNIFDNTLLVQKMLIFPNANCDSGEDKKNCVIHTKADKENAAKIVTSLASLKDHINSVWSEERNLNKRQDQTENLLKSLIALKCLLSFMSFSKSLDICLDDESINQMVALKNTDDRIKQHDFFPSFMLKTKKSKKVTDEKCKKITTDQNVLFLNREQINIYDSKENCQVICGIPGTGKTILIQFKALELKQKFPETRVIVIGTDEIVKHYEKMFALKDIEVYNFCQLRLQMSKHFGTLSELIDSSHIFIDEAQHYLHTINEPQSKLKGVQTHEAQSYLRAFYKKNGHYPDPESYLHEILEVAKSKQTLPNKFWIALDPTQHFYKNQLENTLKQLSSHFVITRLDQVMRCTPELMRYWYPLSEEKDEVKSTMGNRLFSEEVAVQHLPTLDDAASFIAEEIKKLISKENPGLNHVSLSLSDFAILCMSDTDKSELLEALQLKSVPAKFLDDGDLYMFGIKNQVTIVKARPAYAIMPLGSEIYARRSMEDIYSVEWSVGFIIGAHSESSICKRALAEVTIDESEEDYEHQLLLYLYATRCRIRLTLLCIQDDDD